MRFKLSLVLVILCFISLNSVNVFAAKNGTVWDIRFNIPIDKEWVIEFSKPLNENTNWNQYIYVLDSNLEKEDITISLISDRKVKISPPVNGYKSYEIYKLYVSGQLKAADGDKIKRKTEIIFTTKNTDEQDRLFQQGFSYEGAYELAAAQPTNYLWTRQSLFEGPVAPSNKVFSYSLNNYWRNAAPIIGIDDVIYLSANKNGYDTIEAVSPEGDVIWQYLSEVRDEYELENFESPVLGENHILYVMSSHYIYAFNAKNGDIIWKVLNEEQKQTNLAIGEDGTIYVPTLEGVYAYSKLGELIWYLPIDGLTDSTFTISKDGMIYLAGDSSEWGESYIYAINNDGSIEWKKLIPNFVETTITLDDNGTLYFGTGSFNDHDSYIYAMNQNGSVKWTVPSEDWVRSGIAIAEDGTIYAGTDNKFYAITPDGKVKWTFTRTNEEFSNLPIIDKNGVVYVGTTGWENGYQNVEVGNIYAINSNGTLKWSSITNNAIDQPFVLNSEGTLFYISRDDRTATADLIGIR